MSEEQTSVEDEVKANLAAEQTPETEEVEYSETEQEAIEHGWNPDGVEGKANLSAEEFMARQPLYDDLRAQNKRIKRLQEGMEAMKKFNAGIAERERAKVIDELKAAKKVALENENYDAVIEIDDKIVEEQTRSTEPQTNTAFESWVDENPWYHDNPEMKQYADMIGTGYHQTNKDAAITDVYSYVAEEVKKRFPDKFGNPNRGKPSPVEGASKGRQSTSKKYSAKDLPEADRQIMRTIVRAGGITEEEYLKQYYS